MAQFAKVAVDVAKYAMDKLYDYRIPETMAPHIEVGMRVLVPFGRSNKKTEGIILALTNASDQSIVKPVTEVLDNVPPLDASMLKLALWMRDRLFCTLYDIIRVMLPAGLWFAYKTTYTLGNLSFENGRKMLEGDELARSLFETFVQKGSSIEEQALLKEDSTGEKRSALERLVESGIVVKQEKRKQKVYDKTQRILHLTILGEQALKEGRLARSKSSQKAMRFLEGRDGVSVGELCYMTGISKGTVTTLIKKGFFLAEEEEVYRRPNVLKKETREDIILSPKQEEIFRGICKLMDENAPRAALLHGITGSGKTQVYIQLIQYALRQGKTALLLVPEIALTPQMLKEFFHHFDDSVAILHSALSAGERYDEWRRIKKGEARVVIGTRSAVFAPLLNIGLLIVDEEQEHTYKSECTPRYDARIIAKFRCVQSNAVLLLGSATPSIESYYSAQKGNYALFTLNERYFGEKLPEVLIADMRSTVKNGQSTCISDTLFREIKKNREDGEQSILFINRRGNSRLVACLSCGYVPMCAHCSVPLTYHSQNNRLLCHHCGHSIEKPDTCPVCGSRHIKFVGTGTQKVEQELLDRFPGIDIVRMDADTTLKKQAHEKLLEKFSKGKADILLGTQMVTKGLDFEHVTLVGILDADLSLYTSGYRAQERTFCLLTQVIGRAGRRNKRGRAVIQTYSPDHPVIRFAAKQDYEGFYKEEIKARSALVVPPICDIVCFTLSGPEESVVIKAAMRLTFRLKGLLKNQFSSLGAQVLGPVAADVLKVNDRYRYHVSFRANECKARRELIKGVLLEFETKPINRGVSIFVDLNPENE